MITCDRCGRDNIKRNIAAHQKGRECHARTMYAKLVQADYRKAAHGLAIALREYGHGKSVITAVTGISKKKWRDNHYERDFYEEDWVARWLLDLCEDLAFTPDRAEVLRAYAGLLPDGSAIQEAG